MSSEALERAEAKLRMRDSLGGSAPALLTPDEANALLAEVARLEQALEHSQLDAALGRAALAVAREREQPTRKALAALLARHVALVESGDCGFWNAEKEPEVIAARAALAEPEQAEAQGEAAASRSGQGSLDGNAQGSGSASAAADEPGETP